MAAGVARAVGCPLESTGLSFEGGALDVDGCGTALVVKRTWIDDARNRGRSAADVERLLELHLGIRKVIWLELQTTEQDITGGHIDHYARFVREGVVAVHDERRVGSQCWDEERSACDAMAAHLSNETDAAGRHMTVIRVPGPSAPSRKGAEAANSYLNFLITNGAVLLPSLAKSPSSNASARDFLADVFPQHDVIGVAVPEIISGGGGLHCSTMQQPRCSFVDAQDR